MECPSCHRETDPQNRFCSHCGSAQPGFGQTLAEQPGFGQLADQPPGRSSDGAVSHESSPGAADPPGYSVPGDKVSLIPGQDPPLRSPVHEVSAQPHMQFNLAPQNPQPQVMQPMQPPNQQTINVNVSAPPVPMYYAPRPEESYAFAIITLVFYILTLTWPIAVIMNFVGMITGPRRGCFLAMFLVIFLPGVALTALMIVLSLAGAFGAPPPNTF